MVVNKIDKPSARPEHVVDEVLELFIELGADDDQLDFPVVYASALNGTSVNQMIQQIKSQQWPQFLIKLLNMCQLQLTIQTNHFNSKSHY